MSGTAGRTGRWEYHAEKYSTEQDPDVGHLNALGADRWELVTTINGTNNQQVLIFKRPTPTLAEQITLDQRTRVQDEQCTKKLHEQRAEHAERTRTQS